MRIYKGNRIAFATAGTFFGKTKSRGLFAPLSIKEVRNLRFTAEFALSTKLAFLQEILAKMGKNSLFLGLKTEKTQITPTFINQCAPPSGASFHAPNPYSL